MMEFAISRELTEYSPRSMIRERASTRADRTSGLATTNARKNANSAFRSDRQIRSSSRLVTVGFVRSARLDLGDSTLGVSPGPEILSTAIVGRSRRIRTHSYRSLAAEL